MGSCLAHLTQMVEVWSKFHVHIDNKVAHDSLQGGREDLVQKQTEISWDTTMVYEGKLTTISAYFKILSNNL